MPDKESREIIGSMLMFGFEGRSVDRDLERLIREHRLSWVIPFTRNIGSPVQLWELCRELRTRGVFCALDHEGGRVHRFPKELPALPPARTLATAGKAAVEDAGRIHGTELAALGVALSFAPVLDLDVLPDNRVIGDRSYGSDPAKVAELGLAYAGALMANGVLPCGKHFPGHGACAEDSHKQLPRTTAAAGKVQDHIRAFSLALKGMPALMTAHVLFPELDPNSPATTSKPIISGLLRDRLKYTGTVFSDDLEMGALKLSTEDKVLRCIEADVDVMLFCRSREEQEHALQTLYRAVDGRIIRKERLLRSAERIARLRSLSKFAPAARAEDLLFTLELARAGSLAASIG